MEFGLDLSKKDVVHFPDTMEDLPVEWIRCKECKRLTSITIPERVTTIGDRAFLCCKSLTSMTIPENVTTIGCGAFIECERLTSITIILSLSLSIIGFCDRKRVCFGIKHVVECQNKAFDGKNGTMQ